MAGFNVLGDTRYGKMLHNRNDTYIGNSLERYGEWGQEEIELCRQLVRPGGVVLDIGANVGSHTLGFADAVGPGGLVYAFEPQRIVFQTLCANVALNSLTQVVARQQAVGEAPGSLMIPPINPNQVGNFGGLGLGQHAAGEPVPCIRLDDLPLPQCDLVKIDVEGMEAQALRGARATLQRLRPYLYVENDRPAKSPELVRLLDELGYRMYWHITACYNPNNFKGDPVNIFQVTRDDGTIVNISSHNMLCVPKESPLVVQGLTPVEVPVEG